MGTETYFQEGGHNFRATADATGQLAPRVVPEGYDANDDMLNVKSVQKKFRDSFEGASVAAYNAGEAAKQP